MSVQVVVRGCAVPFASVRALKSEILDGSFMFSCANYVHALVIRDTDMRVEVGGDVVARGSLCELTQWARARESPRVPPHLLIPRRKAG